MFYLKVCILKWMIVSVVWFLKVNVILFIGVGIVKMKIILWCGLGLYKNIVICNVYYYVIICWVSYLDYI